MELQKANKAPEHLDIALKMANEIAERFTPLEQNEAVKFIYQTVKDRRLSHLKEAQERAAFLSESLDNFIV